MKISRRGAIGTVAALIASGIGLSELVRRFAPHSSTPAETPAQPDTRALEQAIERYNSASIPEKGRILSDMYDGRARLVAVPYDGHHDHIVGGIGGVFASMPNGVIHVNVHSETASSISLSNSGDNVTVDNQGRLRLYSGHLSGSGYRSIDIPEGHSLLIAESGINRNDIDKLINGLRQFGREYHLFDTRKIGIIRNALQQLSYSPAR